MDECKLYQNCNNNSKLSNVMCMVPYAAFSTGSQVTIERISIMQEQANDVCFLYSRALIMYMLSQLYKLQSNDDALCKCRLKCLICAYTILQLQRCIG
jgi:hypothetical protein